MVVRYEHSSLLGLARDGRLVTLIRFILLIPLITFFIASAQGARLDAEKIAVVKAAYIYKFSKFVIWPDSVFPSETSDIQICLVDTDEQLNKVLLLGTKQRQSRGRIITIRLIQLENNNAESVGLKLTGCNLLYVKELDQKQQSVVFDWAIDNHALLVGDTRETLGVNSIVNLAIEGQRVVFYVNKEALSRSGVQIEATLLMFAKSSNK